VGLQTVYGFIFLVVSMIVVIDVQYFFSSKIILKLSDSYHHARKKYLHSGERKAPHKYFSCGAFIGFQQQYMVVYISTISH
jgi:hypothetical protein